MMEINLGVIGAVLGICLVFGGMLLSSRLIGFSATSQELAVVAVISVVLGLIPFIGWLLSLVGTYIALYRISRDGVILMMIASWIMMLAIAIALTKII